MHIFRRTLTVALLSVICSCVWAQATDPAVTLIYFGTPSCPSCRAWKLFDLPKLKETDEFKASKFVEIQKAIPQPIPNADKFPSDLAPMRDAISNKFGGKISSPMFAIVKGNIVTWTWSGAPNNAQVVKELQAAFKVE